MLSFAKLVYAGCDQVAVLNVKCFSSTLVYLIFSFLKQTFPSLPGTSYPIVWKDVRVDLDPPANWASAKVGDVVNVSMSHSGLTDEAYLNVYVRKACLDLFTVLNESSKDVRMVTGCPGIGKSVEVFSYAMWQAQTHKKRVLYVHGSRLNGIYVLFKDSVDSATARVSRMRPFVKEPLALQQFLLSTLQSDGVDLIVLDGALSWLIFEIYSVKKHFFFEKRKNTLKTTGFDQKRLLSKKAENDNELTIPGFNPLTPDNHHSKDAWVTKYAWALVL